MTRILVIHHYGGLGGAGKSLLINVRRLVKHAQVTIIVPKHPSDMYEILCEISQVNVVGVDYIPSFPVYSGGLSLTSPKLYSIALKSILKYSNFRSLIESIPCDVIIANSMILCWVSLFFPTQIKICFIRESKRSSIANMLIKKCLNRFDLVVFISQFDRKEWGLQTKTNVLENASDIEGTENKITRFNPANADEKLCLLFMGGTSYIKGFYHFILSVLLTKDKARLKLIMLGDSKPLVEKSGQFLLNKFGIESLWYGKVKEISSFLSVCHVLVFPVVKVHQGRPLFEAGAFSKPVIAPDFENLSEFVTDNVNGLTYKRRSSRSLAKCLDRVVKGDFDLVCLGDSNYRRYCEKHTLNSSEKGFKIIIDEILQI